MNQDEEIQRLHALSAVQTADISALLLIVLRLSEIVRPDHPDMPDVSTMFLRVRVSTVAQNHASQLREVRAYVRRRWPKAEIVEYLEKASGAKFSRNALDAMMAEVRKGRIDIVAIYKLDRLGRSLQHLAQLIGELRTHRTALVSTSQGIDTSESNSASRLQMNVLLAVAEFERDAIIERINAGLAAARDRGAKLGRPRTLDQHRAAVTRLRRRGLSGRKIAARLNIPAGSVFALMRELKRAA